MVDGATLSIRSLELQDGAGTLADGEQLYARMCAPALGIEEDPATGSACAALVGAVAKALQCKFS